MAERTKENTILENKKKYNAILENKRRFYAVVKKPTLMPLLVGVVKIDLTQNEQYIPSEQGRTMSVYKFADSGLIEEVRVYTKVGNKMVLKSQTAYLLGIAPKELNLKLVKVVASI